MISPDPDIAKYVQVVIIKGQLGFKYLSERHTISNLFTAKYVFKSCTLAKLWT